MVGNFNFEYNDWLNTYLPNCPQSVQEFGGYANNPSLIRSVMKNWLITTMVCSIYVLLCTMMYYMLRPGKAWVDVVQPGKNPERGQIKSINKDCTCTVDLDNGSKELKVPKSSIINGGFCEWWYRGRYVISSMIMAIILSTYGTWFILEITCSWYFTSSNTICDDGVFVKPSGLFNYNFNVAVAFFWPTFLLAMISMY